MPAPIYSEPLDWENSPLKNPLAIYDVNFATALTWRWENLRGYFDKVEVVPKFVRIDNLESNQFLNVYFDAVRYPVNAFQLLTIPIPPAARNMQIDGDATSLLTCEVTFAVDDISYADTINFKQIQNSGTEGVLWPITTQAGPVNPVAADDHEIWIWFIAGAVASVLPNPTTVSNGWTIQLWNDSTSTANVTVTVSGGATIEGAANLIITPGAKYWLVSNGTNYRIVGVAIKNPEIQIFTANGNWTQSDTSRQLDYIEVEIVGGGGSGGQAPVTGANQSSGGAGGGGGGYSYKKILAAALSQPVAVTIGAGGVASGNAGGTTSFGAHCSATGGGGGGAVPAGVGQFGASGGVGGVGSGGNINTDGERGIRVIRVTAGALAGGATEVTQPKGGNSRFGMGAANAGGAAIAGFNYGGGGGAVSIGQNTAATPGAAGAPGICIVREYYK